MQFVFDESCVPTIARPDATATGYFMCIHNTHSNTHAFGFRIPNYTKCLSDSLDRLVKAERISNTLSVCIWIGLEAWANQKPECFDTQNVFRAQKLLYGRIYMNGNVSGGQHFSSDNFETNSKIVSLQHCLVLFQYKWVGHFHSSKMPHHRSVHSIFCIFLHEIQLQNIYMMTID